MTSCPVLRCLAPRLPVLSVGFGSVFCSMPLGRIAGPPVTPLSLTIPARKSATTCFSAAFSASRRSVRASRSPRDSSERGIFSGTDMLGTNRVRYEQGHPRSSSYLPGFLPQLLNGQQAVTAINALWLRRSTAFRWLQQPIGRHLMIDVVEQVIERHQEVKNEGISERLVTQEPIRRRVLPEVLAGRIIVLQFLRRRDTCRRCDHDRCQEQASCED